MEDPVEDLHHEWGSLFTWWTRGTDICVSCVWFRLCAEDLAVTDAATLWGTRFRLARCTALGRRLAGPRADACSAVLCCFLPSCEPTAAPLGTRGPEQGDEESLAFVMLSSPFLSPWGLPEFVPGSGKCSSTGRAVTSSPGTSLGASATVLPRGDPTGDLLGSSGSGRILVTVRLISPRMS